MRVSFYVVILHVDNKLHTNLCFAFVSFFPYTIITIIVRKSNDMQVN